MVVQSENGGCIRLLEGPAVFLVAYSTTCLKSRRRRTMDNALLFSCGFRLVPTGNEAHGGIAAFKCTRIPSGCPLSPFESISTCDCVRGVTFVKTQRAFCAHGGGHAGVCRADLNNARHLEEIDKKSGTFYTISN